MAEIPAGCNCHTTLYLRTLQRCRSALPTSTDAAPEARHLLVMEVGKEARKDPVPHGTPADQYLTKKYFGSSDVFFQMVPMPDGSSLWMDEQGMLKKLPRNIEAEWRFGQDVHCGRLYGTVVWAPKEEQDEQVEPVEATTEVQDRVDLTVKQIKSITPKAKGSKKSRRRMCRGLFIPSTSTMEIVT